MIGTFIGKSITKIEKLFKFNASSFPGKVVLKLFPNYLKKIKYPEIVIMVTGSTGKGSTVSFIKEVLENNNMKVYVTNSKDGKKAITDYQVLKSNENYSLLDIEIKTGRKNQIRVQLSNKNHPVVGDLKYGFKSKKIKRLCLEANRLILIHPILKKEIDIKLNIQPEFVKLI